MPKNIVKVKNSAGAIVKTRPMKKFRIGTRKSGKSALLMSNDELMNVINDNGKKRHRNKAIKVLRMRGILVQ